MNRIVSSDICKRFSSLTNEKSIKRNILLQTRSIAQAINLVTVLQFVESERCSIHIASKCFPCSIMPAVEFQFTCLAYFIANLSTWILISFRTIAQVAIAIEHWDSKICVEWPYRGKWFNDIFSIFPETFNMSGHFRNICKHPKACFKRYQIQCDWKQPKVLIPRIRPWGSWHELTTKYGVIICWEDSIITFEWPLLKVLDTFYLVKRTDEILSIIPWAIKY